MKLKKKTYMVLIWTWEYLFKKIINTTELIKKKFFAKPYKKKNTWNEKNSSSFIIQIYS